MPWRPLPLSYAVAIYPFQPSSSPAELPLQIGDQLYAIEQGGKDGSWYRGYLVAPPSLLSALNPGGRGASEARVFSGIFPRCCVEIREELGDSVTPRASLSIPAGSTKPPAPVPLLKAGDDSATSSLEPLVDEISSCLREWYVLHLPDLVLQRNYDLLDKMAATTTRLEHTRRELLNDVLTMQERVGLRNQAIWDLVKGNRMLNGEVIVRNPKTNGQLVSAEDSAIEMAKLQSTMSLLDDAPEERIEEKTLNHCLFEVKSVTGTELEKTTLNFTLYQKTLEDELQPFSETYTSLATLKMKTLFADLTSRDIGSENRLFLVVKVVVSEQPQVIVRQTSERAVSRSGTLKGENQDLLTRRRSSLRFGSKKSKEKPKMGPNGKFAPGFPDRAPTPIIYEEPEDDATVSTKPSGPPVPRTIGLGIFDIAKFMRDGVEDEGGMTIWSKTRRTDVSTPDQVQLISSLLASPSGRYAICNRISRLHFSVRPYKAADADDLIRTNPTSMYLVRNTQKIGFSEAPSRPRSDIYLTLSKVSIPTGAQLSHPELGFAPIRVQSLLNLQLTMEVRDSVGRRVDHCIFAASNEPGVTAMRTNAAERGALWDQTVCLRLPASKVPDFHLVLSVADAPDFPFALAWLPLWDNKAFLSDGKHSLILHAYDKSTSSVVNGKGAYLSLPWNNSTFQPGHDGVSAQVASLQVTTRLCSTEFSQHPTIVSLLQWKQQSSVQLKDVLQKLFFVPEIEIISQLRDVLNTLFAVLVHKSGESKFEDLIFNDIVFVLGIIHDRRYNLGPLIERYVEEHFDSPYAASCLVRSFTRLLQSVSDPQSARDMRALFKVGSQFLKLLMASHRQRTFINDNLTADQKHTSFKLDMQAVLFGLQMMMRSETAALVGSKTLLVQNFHTWLPELLGTYTKEQVIKIAINFVDSCEGATGKLVFYRILLILNCGKLEQIWLDQKDRQILVKNCIRWLAPYWSLNDLTDDWRDQVRLCCSVVAELAQDPLPLMHDFIPGILSAYCFIVSEAPTRKRSLSLLFSHAYPFATKQIAVEDDYDEVLLELSALISTLTQIKAPPILKLHDQDLATYILTFMTVLRSILANDTCPATWLSLNIHNHSSALKILSYLSTILTESFLPGPEDAEAFDMELWMSFFETLLVLVSSQSLTLELFPEQKRRAVWKTAGDVRQTGSELLRQSWEALGWDATPDAERRYNVMRFGGYQVQYVPSLVSPIIELCLSMHEGLRKVAVEILQTMIVSEWELSENLDLIETEIIGSLNTVLKSRPAGPNENLSRKLFISELLELFSTIAGQPDDALWTALEELVATIEELIDLLTNADEEEEEPLAVTMSRPKLQQQRIASSQNAMTHSRKESGGGSYGSEAKNHKLNHTRDSSDAQTTKGHFRSLSHTKPPYHPTHSPDHSYSDAAAEKNRTSASSRDKWSNGQLDRLSSSTPETAQIASTNNNYHQHNTQAEDNEDFSTGTCVHRLSSNNHARSQSNTQARAHGHTRNPTSSKANHVRRTSRDGALSPGPTTVPLPAGMSHRSYGTNALECYKALANEYERNGDYKRLAKTHRAIARIHEARANSRLAERVPRGDVDGADKGHTFEGIISDDEDNDDNDGVYAGGGAGGAESKKLQQSTRYQQGGYLDEGDDDEGDDGVNDVSARRNSNSHAHISGAESSVGSEGRRYRAAAAARLDGLSVRNTMTDAGSSLDER